VPLYDCVFYRGGDCASQCERQIVPLLFPHNFV
jgi:hypothetical protein